MLVCPLSSLNYTTEVKGESRRNRAFPVYGFDFCVEPGVTAE